MTFLLIPGAGCDPWYWHLVVDELGDAIAVDLPYGDESADLHDYVRLSAEQAAERDDLVVVGQSLGGFTAPVVAERLGARRIALVCAMVPRPGETADEWWSNTGSSGARREQAARDGRDVDGEFDPVAEFLHDVPDELIAASEEHVGEQAQAPLLTPWPLAAWPDIPTYAVIGANDRFFPPAFQRRVHQDRLGIVPDEIDSGHCPALARPRELAALLRGYAA
jgi:pimeloyl-ACP methyl ester carboxylesterase